jgi:hypothetical protein
MKILKKDRIREKYHEVNGSNLLQILNKLVTKIFINAICISVLPRC